MGISDAASDSRKVVQASEILAAIERGEPVEYDGVIVEGDLDLDGLDLSTKHIERTEDETRMADVLVPPRYVGLTEEAKVVDSSISITNSEIQGGVKFGNAIFRESVDFRGTNFIGGDAYFYWAQFSGDAYFSDAQFGGDTYFTMGDLEKMGKVFPFGMFIDFFTKNFQRLLEPICRIFH